MRVWDILTPYNSLHPTRWRYQIPGLFSTANLLGGTAIVVLRVMAIDHNFHKPGYYVVSRHYSREDVLPTRHDGRDSSDTVGP